MPGTLLVPWKDLAKSSALSATPLTIADGRQSSFEGNIMEKRFIKSTVPAASLSSSTLERVSKSWNRPLRDFFQPMVDWIVESAESERDAYFSRDSRSGVTLSTGCATRTGGRNAPHCGPCSAEQA
jgi:hypothetical protein